MNVKRLYVRGVRVLRRGAQRLGGLSWWDRKARKGRLSCWSRSLLSIYALPDLVSLDVPWWTFDAADVVEEFLATRPGAWVFEWGSGASTVWLAKRAGLVVAVEHDAAWADEVRELVPGNAEVQLVAPSVISPEVEPICSAKDGFAGLDFTDYVSAIKNAEGPFDVIVIDGRAREACLPRALEHLTPGGLIVFDNVDRARYREAIEATDPPLRVVWTWGLTPCLPYPTRTAVITAPSGP